MIERKIYSISADVWHTHKLSRKKLNENFPEKLDEEFFGVLTINYPIFIYGEVKCKTIGDFIWYASKLFHENWEELNSDEFGHDYEDLEYSDVIIENEDEAFITIN